MIPPFNAALAKPFKLKTGLEKSTLGSEGTAAPVQEDAARKILWRVMGSLGLLWLLFQERSSFSTWPPTSAAWAEGVATVVVAVLLLAPALVQSERWLRRTIAGGAALAIVAAFAAATLAGPLASGDANPLSSLALSLLSSSLLPMLAVIALGFSLPSLLLRLWKPNRLPLLHRPTPAPQSSDTFIPVGSSKQHLKFRPLSSQLGTLLSSRLWHSLDLLTAFVGLLALCYIPTQSSEGIASRVTLMVALVTAASLAAYASSYQGNLVLESSERGTEFLIPERFVRGVLVSILFACLGVQLLVAFHSAGLATWLVLLFALWVTARAAMPLLRTGIMGQAGVISRNDETESRMHRERLCLCVGAVAVLSGLLSYQIATGAEAADLFMLLCLLLALAAIGVAAFKPSGMAREPSDGVGASSWTGIKVRLDGNPQTLPVDAALPRLDPRWAKVVTLIIHQVRQLRQSANSLDRLLVQGTSAANTLLRRILQGQVMVVAGNLILVFALCWLAVKDWLTSDAQVYPYAASLAVTLAVGGAAVAARYICRKGLWRDVVLAGAAASCLMALMLPDLAPAFREVMPAAGLLTFALALPKLFFLARLLKHTSPDAGGFGSLMTAAFGSLRQALLAPVSMQRVRGVSPFKQPAKASFGQSGSITSASEQLRQLFEQVRRFFGRLPSWVQSFLHKEVAIRQSVKKPYHHHATLPGFVVFLLYGAAALLGATTLLLTPSETPLNWIPCLLVTTCAAALLIFSARSSWPAAATLPFVAWALCGFLYVYPALTGFSASHSDIRGTLIGTGLSGSLLWDMPAFIAQQGWISWALSGLILLWALDKNAQFLGHQVSNHLNPNNPALPAGNLSGIMNSASRFSASEGQPLETEQPKVNLSAEAKVKLSEEAARRTSLELAVGAIAALAGLLFGALLCPVALALCAASLVIAARLPRPQAAAIKAEGASCAVWVRPVGRLRFAWVSIVFATAAIGLGALCAAAWSLPGLGSSSATFLPLLSVPKVLRDAVPSDLPAAASWQDGFCLLRCGFGSQVSVPPSMSAAVALRLTGADQSRSPLRAVAAALLAPALGRWLPAARLEELYLNDRDYGLPLSVQRQSSITSLETATQYYFHAEPQALTLAQAHFLLGEQPLSGEPPFHFTQASLMPMLTELNAPHLHLEVFVPPVPNFYYAHHDGSVNNRGALVSSAITRDGVRPFVWEAGQMQVLHSLGTDSGDFAVKINDAGQCVGWSMAADGTDHAALWETGGQVHDLGTLPGFANSHARSINSQGEVVGYAFNDTAGNPLEKASHAFLWEDGHMHDLGVLPGCTGSRAYAINDVGQIAGWVMIQGGGTHAAVWEDNRVCDLGTFPGGKVSVANAINNAGQVVGSAQHKDGHVSAFLWQNGILHDLGALPGDIYSSARDINSLGQIVGMSRPDLGLNKPGGRAFVWDGVHGLRDLSALVDAAAPLRNGLSRNCQPFAINDQGQVLGLQFDAGARRTFFMTPASLDKRGIAAQLGTGRAYRLLCVNSGKVAGVGGASKSEQAKIIQWQPNGGQDQEWVAISQAGGFWEFVNRNSGKCLEAAGPPSVLGGAIYQTAPNGHHFQEWSLQPVVDNSFKLVNRGTGLLMDVEDRSTQDGAKLHQWKDVGGLNQHWLFQVVR